MNVVKCNLALLIISIETISSRSFHCSRCTDNLLASAISWETFALRHQKQLKFLQLIEFQLSLNSLIVKLSRLLLIEFLFAFISTPLLSSFSLLLTHSFLAENVTMLTTKQRKKSSKWHFLSAFQRGRDTNCQFSEEKANECDRKLID